MSNTLDDSCKGQTLVDRVVFWGETDPDTPAFIFWGGAGRRVLTRWDVLDLSSRFANRLRNIGVLPSDYICIVLPNSPERVIVNFGIILAGAISMNGNQVRTDGEDLIQILNDSKCKTIILDSNQKPGPWEICRNVSRILNLKDTYAEIESEKIPYLKNILFCGREGNSDGFLASCRSEMEKYIYVNGVSTEICNVFNTSGSSGYSKLVPHTHECILTFGCILSRTTKADLKTFFNISPLGWSGGFPAVYLFSGATRVAIDEFSGQILDKTSLVWDMICRENVDIALMLPSLASALMDQKAKRKDDMKLKMTLTGGQPLKRNHLQIMKEVTESLTIMYASTEVGFMSSLTLGKNYCVASYDNFNVGKPLEGVTVQIVDNELNPVPEGSWGEILTKAHTTTSGYVGSSGSTENFLPDGWFRTGDIGLVDQNGDLFVKGRSSDAIMHGAYILFPEWLEGKFQSCPDVKEIAIVPVPDLVLHHEICACIIPNDPGLTQDTFIRFCKSETVLEQDSPLSIIPKFVLFFKTFPQTGTGKLDRRKLAQMARSQLNL